MDDQEGLTGDDGEDQRNERLHARRDGGPEDQPDEDGDTDRYIMQTLFLDQFTVI